MRLLSAIKPACHGYHGFKRTARTPSRSPLYVYVCMYIGTLENAGSCASEYVSWKERDVEAASRFTIKALFEGSVYWLLNIDILLSGLRKEAPCPPRIHPFNHTLRSFTPSFRVYTHATRIRRHPRGVIYTYGCTYRAF